MVVQTLGNLKGFLKCKRTRIDHTVFRLHYRFTVLLLLVFCIIVTTKQYGGEPIMCTRDSKHYSGVVDNYCLITTTYTIKSAYNVSIQSNKDNPHPGIKPSQDPKDFLYHRYYQYVGLSLFFQAVCFYFPHWLWKTLEGEKLEFLLSGINIKLTCLSKAEINNTYDKVLDYLHSSWGEFSFYPIKYFVCELLCFINIVCQIVILDLFFDGEFAGYGIDFIHSMRSDKNIFDPMIKVFPRVTICNFKYYGESGKVDQMSLLCILSINVINEKIYVFLWFWFVSLAVISLWVVVFRLISFVVRPLRFLMLRARFRNSDPAHLQFLIRRGSLADWFILHLIGQNIDDVDFRNFVRDMSEKLSLNKCA